MLFMGSETKQSGRTFKVEKYSLGSIVKKFSNDYLDFCTNVYKFLRMFECLYLVFISYFVRTVIFFNLLEKSVPLNGVSCSTKHVKRERNKYSINKNEQRPPYFQETL